MKTIEKTLIVLLIVLSTSLSYGGITENARVQLRERGEIVQLLYKESNSGKVKITIKNDEGQVVMSEQVNNNYGFLRNYDFSNLKAGLYTFEVADSKGQVQKEIEFIKKSPVAFIAQGDKYKIIYGSKKKTSVLVAFLDKKGKVVFEDRFVSTNGFSKTYKVDKKLTSAETLRLVTDTEAKEYSL